MSRLLPLGADHVHRDSFHADYGFGRYAQALTLYNTSLAKAASDVLKSNDLI